MGLANLVERLGTLHDSRYLRWCCVKGRSIAGRGTDDWNQFTIKRDLVLSRNTQSSTSVTHAMKTTVRPASNLTRHTSARTRSIYQNKTPSENIPNTDTRAPAQPIVTLYQHTGHVYSISRQVKLRWSPQLQIWYCYMNTKVWMFASMRYQGHIWLCRLFIS